MKKIELGQTITILANIGLLVGLTLVSIQINQSTAIAEAQLASDYFLADMQLELSMMGDDPISSFVKAVYAPGELTERDAGVLDRYFNYGLIQVDRLVQMRDAGLADAELVNRQVDYMKWHLGNPAGRTWWAEYRMIILPAKRLA